jgi:hypothetical protein
MRHVLALIGAVLLVVSLVGAAVAQSPSPQAGASEPAAGESPGAAGESPGAPSGDSPRVGEPVEYVSQGGVTLATVTVEEVNLEYDEFSEFFDPNPDADYIGVVYTFEGGEETTEVNTFNLSLETRGGFLWGTAFVSRPDEVEVPDLESSFNLNAGENENGLVVFEVSAGSELVRLWWQPDTGRLLELADLRES